MNTAVNTVSATVIFDNAGTVTVQLTDGTDSWAHHYDGDMLREAAGDVHAALYSGGFSHYDGHEDTAAECSPTSDEIRNGGYRVHRFETLSEYEDFCLADHSGSWGNIVELTAYVRRGEL